MRQLKIKPDDIDGHYDCEVQLLAEPPEALDIRKTLGTNLQKAGVLSNRTNLSKYHDMSKEEVEDEIAQLYAEKAMQLPGMLEFMGHNAMERLGMKQVAEGFDKLTGTVPPRRLPETMGAGSEGVTKRGRQTPEMERGVVPQEAEVSNIPME